MSEQYLLNVIEMGMVFGTALVVVLFYSYFARRYWWIPYVSAIAGAVLLILSAIPDGGRIMGLLWIHGFGLLIAAGFLLMKDQVKNRNYQRF